jgi:hypothetical protein
VRRSVPTVVVRQPLKAFYTKHGWKGYWQKQLEYAKQRAERGYYEPYFMVWLYLRLGEKQQALDWLEKAYESRSPWIATIKYDPLLDNLRADRRFQELERHVGFPSHPQ